MRAKFIPDQKAYEDYYMHRGHGGYYTGLPVQYGHGLGGLIAGLVRTIAPVLRRAAVPAIKQVGKLAMKRAIPMSKKIAKHAITAGLTGLGDVVAEKKSSKQALADSKKLVRKRVAELLQNEVKKKKKRGSARSIANELDIFNE